MAGSQTLHSSLAVLVSYAARRGEYDLAARLAAEASGIESDFSVLVKGFLREHDMSDLPASTFYPELVQARVAALDRVPSWRQLLFADRVVDHVSDDLVSIAARISRTDERVELAVAREAGIATSVVVGDALLVFRDVMPTSAMVIELLEGISARSGTRSSTLSCSNT